MQLCHLIFVPPQFFSATSSLVSSIFWRRKYRHTSQLCGPCLFLEAIFSLSLQLLLHRLVTLFMFIFCHKLSSTSASPLTITFNRNWWIPLFILSLCPLYIIPFHVPKASLIIFMSPSSAEPTYSCLYWRTAASPPSPSRMLAAAILASLCTACATVLAAAVPYAVRHIQFRWGRHKAIPTFPVHNLHYSFLSSVCRTWLRDSSNLYLSPSFSGRCNAIMKKNPHSPRCR
jgi:hypothetical protein